jgi:hypothetical protein
MKIDAHVSAAVEEILSTLSPGDIPTNGTLVAAVHARLWPYVAAAVAAAVAARDLPPSGSSDRRIRPWQYTARFWNLDGELIAETDPCIMQGTGGLPLIVLGLARELHGGAELQAPMTAEGVKERLPQLRNNLGRADSATLRMSYTAQGTGLTGSFACQIDVYRLA